MAAIETQHEELMNNGEACHAVRDYIAHFANPLRLRILCALTNGEASVSELVDVTGAKQPAVSQQLNLLRLSNVVTRERVGNRSVYQISDPIAAEVMEFILTIARKLMARNEEPAAGTC